MPRREGDISAIGLGEVYQYALNQLAEKCWHLRLDQRNMAEAKAHVQDYLDWSGRTDDDIEEFLCDILAYVRDKRIHAASRLVARFGPDKETE